MQKQLKKEKVMMYDCVKPTFYCILYSQIVLFIRNFCNETNELDHKTDLNDSLTNKCAEMAQ